MFRNLLYSFIFAFCICHLALAADEHCSVTNLSILDSNKAVTTPPIFYVVTFFYGGKYDRSIFTRTEDNCSVTQNGFEDIGFGEAVGTASNHSFRSSTVRDGGWITLTPHLNEEGRLRTKAQIQYQRLVSWVPVKIANLEGKEPIVDRMEVDRDIDGNSSGQQEFDEKGKSGRVMKVIVQWSINQPPPKLSRGH